VSGAWSAEGTRVVVGVGVVRVSGDVAGGVAGGAARHSDGGGWCFLNLWRCRKRRRSKRTSQFQGVLTSWRGSVGLAVMGGALVPVTGSCSGSWCSSSSDIDGCCSSRGRHRERVVCDSGWGGRGCCRGVGDGDGDGGRGWC
jgi:hypothetical protein